MRYDPSQIPSSVAELYTSGWADFMRLKISRFNLHDINNSVEDIMQDMMVQMIANGYIEKYQKDGRPFEVYLSVFIFNFMSKRYKKEYGSKHGQQIILSKSIEESSNESDKPYDGSVVSLEHLEDEKSNFDGYFLLVESIRTDLKDIEAKSSVIYKGKVYERKPLTVFNLLEEGYTVSEISKMLDVSKQFIYLLLNKIRNCETLLEH